MRLLVFLGAVIIVLFVAFMLTQVLAPLVFGGRLFPAFRKSRASLESQIRETEDELAENDLQAKLDDLKAKLRADRVAQLNAAGTTPTSTDAGQSEQK